MALQKRVVLQKGDNSLDATLVSRLAPGVYFIGVATDKQQQIVKFVRE